MLEEYIHQSRVYIQKMSKENRDSLFVEVNQKDLKINIFNPIYNLFKYESHFFPKRFAILGEFRTGKTELGKFIVQKMKSHYEDCISLTINSQGAQYRSKNEIDMWLYTQWYYLLLQASNQDFKGIITSLVKDFISERGSEPQSVLDKIYLICKAYKEYLKVRPGAKFIVEFDQANVIEFETQFKPFYEFWRNFQGFWENNEYFSELPIFIFVIGHRNWMNFALLKDPIGRGVFDKWVIYEYWNNADIEEMYKKRLLYAIKPEYRDKLMNYFLCSGVVDYYGKMLGKVSTYEYLDQFFGKYFRDFLVEFRTNLEEYENFLEYCKKKSLQKKVDETYFTKVEKSFIGNPALDYMPVFHYLSDNQNEKWFEELSNLIKDIYEINFVTFESKDFKKYPSFNYKFIYENFTYSPLTGMRPIYNPPLFTNYENKLILNDTFRRSLEAIEGLDKRGPIYLLKRFIKSKRIGRNKFIESEDGKKIEHALEEILQNSNKIFDFIQKWVVNGYIEEFYLNPFYKVKDFTFNLKQLYEKNSTNWAIFDNVGREISNFLVDGTFPKNSEIVSQLNLKAFDEIRNKIISPETSGLPMAQHVKDLLMIFAAELENLDRKLLEDESLFVKNGKLKLIENNVLTIIDGPNSLGEDFQDKLDLEKVSEYAHSLDKNAELYYLTKFEETSIDKVKISRIGYDVLESHKDVDYKMKNLIRKNLNSIKPPNIILLGAKDQDYRDFIKQIRKDFNVRVILVISSENGLANSMKRAFDSENIKFFPTRERRYEEGREEVFDFIEGRMGDPISYHISGKISLPDKYAEKQPNVGEKWVCRIKYEKDNCIILTLINKVLQGNK